MTPDESVSCAALGAGTLGNATYRSFTFQSTVVRDGREGGGVVGIFVQSFSVGQSLSGILNYRVTSSIWDVS